MHGTMPARSSGSAGSMQPEAPVLRLNLLLSLDKLLEMLLCFGCCHCGTICCSHGKRMAARTHCLICLRSCHRCHLSCSDARATSRSERRLMGLLSYSMPFLCYRQCCLRFTHLHTSCPRARLHLLVSCSRCQHQLTHDVKCCARLCLRVLGRGQHGSGAGLRGLCCVSKLLHAARGRAPSRRGRRGGGLGQLQTASRIV